MKKFITLLAVIFTTYISYTVAQTPKNNDTKLTFEERDSSRIITSERDGIKCIKEGSSRTITFDTVIVIDRQKTNGYSMAVAYTNRHRTDTIIIAKYYVLIEDKSKQVECIGCVNWDAPSFILFAPEESTYVQVWEAVNSFMQPYHNKTNSIKLQALEQAANDSRERLEKIVGSLSVSRYNINSDKGIFKYSGIMSEPYDFMEEAAIDEYIAKKAKMFKYTKSTHKADIKKAMLNGDPETIKFANACLNDEIEF